MRTLLSRLSTREAVLLGLFASLLVLAKAALRWHLHIPGHSQLTAILFLVLACVCVPRRGAATATGLIAGLATAVLGMGKGGPLIVAKLLIPGLVVDTGAAVSAGLRPEVLRWALVGLVAGASGFVPNALVELLGGAAPGIVAQHALVTAGSKGAFGLLGGIAAAVVLSRLRDHAILDAPDTAVQPTQAGSTPAGPGA